VRSGIVVRVHEYIETPLTWGVRRPIILLPTALLSAEPAVRESALRHEQAHIARWDWLWNLLAEIVCVLCWFQPGAWWLRSRLRFESERACDDRVLLSGIAAPDYAAHLLQIVQAVRSTVRSDEVAPAMAQRRYRRGWEERMKHILDDVKPRRTQARWRAVSASFALALFSLTALRVSARPAPPLKPMKPTQEQPTQPIRPARPAEAKPQLNKRTTRMKPDSSRPRPAKSVEQTRPDGPANPTITPIVPDRATQRAAPQATITPSAAPTVRLSDVIWGDAVDGLEPGFLLTTTGSPNIYRVPFNSQVDYQVLVRNSTDQTITIQVRRGATANVWNTSPYFIPADALQEALRSSPVSDRFRVIDVTLLVPWPSAYAVRLAPGETVVIPGGGGLYIGDSDSGKFPRVGTIQAGMNWIVQPISVHRLNAEEEAEMEAVLKTPYSSKSAVTIIDRTGRVRQASIALAGARTGGTQLFAKIQLEVGTRNAAAARSASSATWGAVDKGLQCGIRLLTPKRAFQIGDTLEAEILWRNVSDAPITSPLPRALDLYPIVQTAGGSELLSEILIDFGARFNIYPMSHTFEPGEVRSLGVTRITLVAPGTPSPKSNQEPGHLSVAPGSYALSGLGGVSAPGGGNPRSGAIRFQVIAATSPDTLPARDSGASSQRLPVSN
jgi:hypothetical protein